MLGGSDGPPRGTNGTQVADSEPEAPAVSATTALPEEEAAPLAEPTEPEAPAVSASALPEEAAPKAAATSVIDGLRKDAVPEDAEAAEGRAKSSRSHAVSSSSMGSMGSMAAETAAVGGIHGIHGGAVGAMRSMAAETFL